jgi:hypothetical protein
VSFQRLAGSVLALGRNSEFVLVTFQETHDFIVGTPDKFTDWFPVTGAGIHLLHNIVRNGASSIIL